MDQTKRTLVFVAGILNLISAFVVLISGLFVLLNFGNITNINLGYDYTVSSPEELRIVKLLVGIILLVIFAFYLCAGILLIYSVRNGGENFYRSQAVFIAGLVLTVLCGPLSISSILLYISLTIKQKITNFDLNKSSENFEVNEKQMCDIKIGERAESVKEKLIKIKKLKDSGNISEEEYKKVLIKYLRTLKEKGEISEKEFQEFLLKII